MWGALVIFTWLIHCKAAVQWEHASGATVTVSESRASVIVVGHVQELDKILACKIYGYRTVGELYDDSNGTVWIPRIRTPCLLISADDDPFLDPV